MLELQKDYHEYLKQLKQNGYGSSEAHDQDAEECYKNSDETPWNIVNREVVYLKDAAVGFGKAHNLEKLVRPLYEGGAWDFLKKPTPRTITTKKMLRNSMNNGYYSDLSLSWPINKKQFWISSYFGPRKKQFHYGIDMAARKGTAIFPAMEGVVIETSNTEKGYGKSIVIDHGKCRTRYAHLSEILVKVGDRVTTAKQIGCVGATGLVRGKNDASHLHFEVIDLFGKRINPLYILK